jgi:hypothetical protein
VERSLRDSVVTPKWGEHFPAATRRSSSSSVGRRYIGYSGVVNVHDFALFVACKRQVALIQEFDIPAAAT